MEDVVYYLDEESGLNVTSVEGEHFYWYLENKMNMTKVEFKNLNNNHKQDIASNYVAEYIPR